MREERPSLGIKACRQHGYTLFLQALVHETCQHSSLPMSQADDQSEYKLTAITVPAPVRAFFVIMQS